MCNVLGEDFAKHLSPIGTIRETPWFKDQYKSPHEISYTISEVLQWFKEKDLKITKILPIDNLNLNKSLFDRNIKVYKNLSFKEFMLTFNINHASEGGLFTIIAKK